MRITAGYSCLDFKGIYKKNGGIKHAIKDGIHRKL
jgi:hypothetical protein